MYLHPLQVNENGHITPQQPYDLYILIELPIEVAMIAVYWADCDTRPHDRGYVWYRVTTEPTLLQQALNDTQRAYPSVSYIDYLLIAAWDHVGYFSQHTDKVICMTIRVYYFHCYIALYTCYLIWDR